MVGMWSVRLNPLRNPACSIGWASSCVFDIRYKSNLGDELVKHAPQAYMTVVSKILSIALLVKKDSRSSECPPALWRPAGSRWAKEVRLEPLHHRFHLTLGRSETSILVQQSWQRSTVFADIRTPLLQTGQIVSVLLPTTSVCSAAEPLIRSLCGWHWLPTATCVILGSSLEALNYLFILRV